MPKQTLPRLLVSREEANKKLQARIDKGPKICSKPIGTQNELRQARDQFGNWSKYNRTLLTKLFSDTSVADYYYSLSTQAFMTVLPVSFSRELEMHRRNVGKHISRLDGICEQLELYGEPSTISQRSFSNTEVSEFPAVRLGNEVFIVHGRDDGAKDAVALFIRDLGFKEIILDKKPNSGLRACLKSLNASLREAILGKNALRPNNRLTIIEKFEKHASNTDFAIALLTPDDVGALREGADNELKSRARQNAILELGYFMGKLGRKKVCLIIKGKLENPSDLDGVLHVPMGNSDDWRMKVAKEMKQAGLPVDMNKLA